MARAHRHSQFIRSSPVSTDVIEELSSSRTRPQQALGRSRSASLVRQSIIGILMASNSSSVAANIARRSQPAKATKTIPIVMLAVNGPVVDKILHGANPADLPVAGATQVTFSVNREALKTNGSNEILHGSVTAWHARLIASLARCPLRGNASLPGMMPNDPPRRPPTLVTDQNCDGRGAQSKAPSSLARSSPVTADVIDSRVFRVSLPISVKKNHWPRMANDTSKQFLRREPDLGRR